PDLARVGLGGPRQDLDQGALAGAVVADEGGDLARVDREVSTRQGADHAVALDDAACLQQRLAHLAAPLSARVSAGAPPGGGRSSTPAKRPAAMPPSRAAPRAPASVTCG